mgnify:CR=1 FL=1
MMPLSVMVRLNRFNTGRHMEIKRQRDRTHASATKNVIHSCRQLPHRIRTAGAPMSDEQNSDEKSHWALSFEIYGTVSRIPYLAQV